VRLALTSIVLGLAASAWAVTPLSPAESMAQRSGEVIGAAAACGVPESRLVAVGRTTVYRIREVARTPAEAERARKLHERTVASTAMKVRNQQNGCPTAIEGFERAERN
jgi:hypothetical protein